MNRVKIVEKEREGLEGEKMAAEAYLHKDAERLGTQSKIFQRFMSDGQVRTAGLHCCTWLCIPHATILVSGHPQMLMPRYAKQRLPALHV